MYDTSDTDAEGESSCLTGSQKGRRNIRNIKELEDLNLDTRIANEKEKERIQRIDSIEKKFQDALGGREFEDQMVLDYDFENNIPLVSVHKCLVDKLKSHQKEGVKFMWNACYESLEQIKKSEGSGCIIAHCMGLGKTFQVVTLVHTLLSHEQIGTRTVLICCPKNTLLNWINEFRMWITSDLGEINLYNPTRYDNHSGRLMEITKWQSNGGVCIINYELFRILLENGTKDTKQFPLRQKQKFQEYLCNPGPDLVICDEGHVLKNEETKLSRIMNQIRTLRRIVLTGTPMQNNLKEYHCMVQFVKPNLLGTRKEFLNMFVNPILNGQYENSLVQDVQIMKERSHILHKKLLGCVQRFDLTTLTKFLPEKQEYVISIALTDSQIEMYRYYLENYSTKGDSRWKNQNAALLSDYQSLQRIWTHPLTLKMYGDKHQEFMEQEGKQKLRKRRKESRNEENSDDSSDSDIRQWTRCPLSWWVRFATSDDIEDVRKSNKLLLFLKILQECEDANEKLLLFSGSLYSLRMIEHFLKRINRSEFEDPCLCNMTSTWEMELDYLVLTGQTSSEDRDRYCKSFNNTHDTRLRLFLISTKAGGMGINLTAANRAILFDVSWNPSHDIQSIFRIYRIGQTKSCFVYRFVASGTMEEKIYERQVAKQSISHRVVDEKQIARHYTERELLELYQFEPDKEHKISHTQPKDSVLQKILKDESDIVCGIHEHDSLLEHKEEEELHEMEKKDAWTAYNNLNDFDNLPEAEKAMLQHLRPESFDPMYLRKVLERKYKKATGAEITFMMTQLMPKINNILMQPDFIDIMKREALLIHKSRLSSRHSRQGNNSKFEQTIVLSDNEENTGVNSIIVVNPSPNGKGNYSENEESVFVRSIGKSNRKKVKGRKSFSKKPLKEWGARNGREFGSPERDLY